MPPHMPREVTTRGDGRYFTGHSKHAECHKARRFKTTRENDAQHNWAAVLGRHNTSTTTAWRLLSSMCKS